MTSRLLYLYLGWDEDVERGEERYGDVKAYNEETKMDKFRESKTNPLSEKGIAIFLALFFLKKDNNSKNFQSICLVVLSYSQDTVIYFSIPIYILKHTIPYSIYDTKRRYIFSSSPSFQIELSFLCLTCRSLVFPTSNMKQASDPLQAPQDQ